MPITRRGVVLAVRTVVVFLLAVGPARGQLAPVFVAQGLGPLTGFLQDPVDPAVQYIVEQAGRIKVMRNGVVLATDFLDISASIASGGEQGLLGLAFSPDFATSGRFYVNFTNPSGDTVVARFKRSAGNALVADPASRFDLLWSTGERVIRQPFANHNGGQLMFGPDGFLYIGMGDGGSANDPGNRAQDPTTLLGKMLRIDVSVPDGDLKGFRVPPDNPFLDGQPVAALPETWDFGMRNPWRFSFDDPARGGTGALVIADVGQSRYEEIDYEPRGLGGRNYGWRVREGAHDNVDVPGSVPAFTPMVDPIFEYDHTVGVAVVGGFVYRGVALGPGYAGRYFYADLNGRVWSLGLSINATTGAATVVNQVEHTSELGIAAAGDAITSFGQDAAGELYIVTFAGRVIKIAPFAIGTDTGNPNAPSFGSVFWRNATTGQNALWQMNGATVVSSHVLPPVADANWQMAATADFNGDGKPDIVWHNRATGANALWLMDAATVVGDVGLPTVADTNWEIVAAADFDGDGRPDLLWRHAATGGLAMWRMVGTVPVGDFGLPSVSDTNWEVVAAADLDADGRADILWRNRATGANAAWFMRGATVAANLGLAPVPDTTWQIVAATDLDGNGKPDVVWRNAVTGANAIWFMDGIVPVANVGLPAVTDVNWWILRPR